MPYNPNPCSRKFTVKLISVAVLSALAVFFLYHLFFLKSILPINRTDALFAYLSRYSYITDAYKNGHLVFWNPFINLGKPAVDAANPYNIITVIFYLLFKPWYANSFYVLTGLCCLFFFSWLYMRLSGFGFFASLAGCISYALSGVIFYFHSYNVYGYFMLPVSLSALLLWDRYKQKKILVFLYIFLCVTALSSGFYNFIVILLAVFITRAVHIRSGKNKGLYLLLWGTALFCLYFVISAYIVPFKAWSEESARGGIPLTRSYGYYPDFKNMVSAIFLGRFLDIKKQVYEAAYYYYVGIPVFILAGFGIREAMRKRKNIFLFFALSCVAPIGYFIFRLLLSLKFTGLPDVAYWRAMPVFILALSMLASCGTDFLLSGKCFKKLPIIISKSFFIAVFFLMLYFNLSLARQHVREWCYSGNVRAFETLGKYYHLISDYINSDKGKGRITAYGARKLEYMAISDLRVIPAYSNIQNKALRDALLKDDLITSHQNIEDRYLWWSLSKPDGKKLALYGVKYLMQDQSNPIPNEFKDAWVPTTIPNLLRNRYSNGRSYIISQNGDIQGRRVIVDDINGETVRCFVKGVSPGASLVLADLAYPGWSVSVNGELRDWTEYHGCMRQVRLEPGDNVVEWRYDAKAAKEGIILSFSGALFFGIVLCTIYMLDKKGTFKNEDTF